MAVLYLQGGALEPRCGLGGLVHAVDWPRGLVAPHLDPDWLAQPFQEQLDCVEAWLEEAEAVIGFAWGAHLLLCALNGAAGRGRSLPPGLFLSCFFNKGQFTGQEGTHYRLPRAREIREALSENGSLSGGEFRFVHGEEDAVAPFGELQFLQRSPFTVQQVRAGHRLLGPGQETIRQELHRMRERLVGSR